MFWWASLAAVGTAIDGMLIDGNGNLLVRRAAQDDGMWKPDGENTSTSGTTTPQTTTTTTNDQTSSTLSTYELATKSKGMVVGSVTCAGLAG